MGIFSYLIANIRLSFINFLLLKFFKIKEQGLTGELLHHGSCSVSVSGDIYIWLMMQCTCKALPLKARFLKGDVTNLNCNLAFDQDQEIIETTNPGKQEDVFYLELFLQELGSHKVLSSCIVVSRQPNATRWSAIDVRRLYCSP